MLWWRYLHCWLPEARMRRRDGGCHGFPLPDVKGGTCAHTGVEFVACTLLTVIAVRVLEMSSRDSAERAVRANVAADNRDDGGIGLSRFAR